MKAKLLVGIMALAALGGASLLSAGEAEMKDMYPHLNSNVDGTPATCTLKRAETKWLTEQMDKGNIRTATPVDIETLFLPLSRGYGSIKSLHYAMTDDAALKGKPLSTNDNMLDHSPQDCTLVA